ncbi:MAG: ATP-dependent DNA ligase [Thermoproteota archaeon]
MEFLELAKVCDKVSKTRKRNEKIKIIAEFLSKLQPEEIAPSTLLIAGKVFSDLEQKPLEIGYVTLSKALNAAKQGTLFQRNLSILDVKKAFEEIASASGKNSRTKKESILKSLLSNASELERKYIIKNIFGEMQHGVGEGLLLQAIAYAINSSEEDVRRAYMFLGDIGETAKVALTGGIKAIREVNLELFRPMKPMLAEMTYDFEEPLREHGGKTAVEVKFDGARVQVHKKGNKIRVYSRRLSDVTESLPDVVEEVRKELRAEEAVLDGEVIAIGSEGKPLPFQELMRRFGRIREVQKKIKEIKLKLYVFDLLYLNGKVLVDESYESRTNKLYDIVGSIPTAPRIIATNVDEVKNFFEKAIKEGHEGVMAKALRSNYIPGSREKKWFKIKSADTLDLVIVGADWGYGRRTGWLSDYYLAALDEEKNQFEIVGKTFKGLTDEEFKQMTKRLQELKIRETAHTVFVRPEIVVEVAYSEIQRSPTYSSGYALRFARITRIREDKNAYDITTIKEIRRRYLEQFKYKGRIE